jgi:hypothetical protein
MDTIQVNDEVVVTAPDGAKCAGKVLRVWHDGAVRVGVWYDGARHTGVIDTVAVEGHGAVASGYTCARVVATDVVATDPPKAKSAKGAKGD